MYSEVLSIAITGLTTCIVNVETDVDNGIPYFEMSGCLSTMVRESKERIQVSIRNSGFKLKPQRIIVNISPADVRKAGTGFDLPIAIGILMANSMLKKDLVEQAVFLGELSLDGSINSVNGILPSVIAAKEAGLKRIFIPKANEKEARILDGLEICPVANLKELTDYLNGINKLSPSVEVRLQEREDKDVKVDKVDNNEIRDNKDNKDRAKAYDYLDIVGQKSAKRAVMIAAAGMHNIMLEGAPGAGKTMIAERIPGILPDLEMDEKLEITKIYSIAGILKDGDLIYERPFRNPHHSVTQAAMLGGGAIPRPGEITLATSGVLFLDELTEYKAQILESLRQPLEDKYIRLVRVGLDYVFPADFMLVAAMNPCKCGYYPDRLRCNCKESDIRRFRDKISQPMWDRFDMKVHIESVGLEELIKERDDRDETFTTSKMKEAVERARLRQKERFEIRNYRDENDQFALGGRKLRFNSDMNAKDIKSYCPLSDECSKVLRQAYSRFGLTMRAYNKIIKVARTIADLDDSDEIGIKHLLEAISYRVVTSSIT